MMRARFGALERTISDGAPDVVADAMRRDGHPRVGLGAVRQRRGYGNAFHLTTVEKLSGPPPGAPRRRGTRCDRPVESPVEHRRIPSAPATDYATRGSGRGTARGARGGSAMRRTRAAAHGPPPAGGAWCHSIRPGFTPPKQLPNRGVQDTAASSTPSTTHADRGDLPSNSTLSTVAD